MSFEIQDLPDIIRIITLISIRKNKAIDKYSLRNRIDKICAGHVCVDEIDIDKTLLEMSSEELVNLKGETIEFTEKGIKLGKQWQNIFLKQEPILQLIAGLADGSITGLVVIISAFVGKLGTDAAIFAALLTLAAVAITNFSSFFLGGITEDLSILNTLISLLHYSVSDIQDTKERERSMLLLQELFILLSNDIRRSNTFAAITCGTTTFVAGSIPIFIYLQLPKPLDIIISLSFVGTVIGIFLVRYRAKKSKINWKISFIETIVIVSIAAIISLFLGLTA